MLRRLCLGMVEAPGWRGRRGLLGLLLLWLCASPLIGGCFLFKRSHSLETGYQYQPLNSTNIQRRAFYADPYSIEARRAQAERQQQADEQSPALQP